MLKQDLARGNP